VLQPPDGMNVLEHSHLVRELLDSALEKAQSIVCVHGSMILKQEDQS
jgi:hypothetical protein